MSGQPNRTVRMSYLVASAAGALFFVMSVVLLGVLPTRALNADMRSMAPGKVPALTASELHGREIYAREGCAYCHTQQIRYLQQDMTRFGAPTLAWETAAEYPQMWGTRRIGPDLSRESGVRSDDWQLAHLYAPRAVVPLSVMPAYPSLFAGAADQPTADARDLVAYLSSLGRAREAAAPEGETRAREACKCPNDAMAQMAFEMRVINAHAARPRRASDAPVLPPITNREEGMRLYTQQCAGCHGVSGTGDGPAAAGLRPRPTDLSEHRYSTERLSQALWNGVAGTAMPAWRDYPLEQLAVLAEAVRGLNADHIPNEPPAVATALGARVYAANCAQCHGERGRGDGFGAASLAIAPTNFQLQQPSSTAAESAIRNGIGGTPMAPWTSRLSPDEISAVAEYVRGLFAGAGSAPPRAGWFVPPAIRALIGPRQSSGGDGA